MSGNPGSCPVEALPDKLCGLGQASGFAEISQPVPQSSILEDPPAPPPRVSTWASNRPRPKQALLSEQYHLQCPPPTQPCRPKPGTPENMPQPQVHSGGPKVRRGAACSSETHPPRQKASLGSRLIEYALQTIISGAKSGTRKEVNGALPSLAVVELPGALGRGLRVEREENGVNTNHSAHAGA